MASRCSAIPIFEALGKPLLACPQGTEFHLNLFYPALMILEGAHYLPFTFLYGMRIFLPLSAILAGGGVVIALYFPGAFSLGGWIGGLTLFIFAWIGRVSVQNDLRVEA